MQKVNKINKLIPREANLYTPRGTLHPHTDEQWITTSKEKIRIMFCGKIEFSMEEHQKIDFFRQFLAKHPSGDQLLADPTYHSYHPRWEVPNILRFLVANKFDHGKTADCMVQHTEWRKNWIPVQPNPRSLDILVGLLSHRAEGLRTSLAETTGSGL